MASGMPTTTTVTHTAATTREAQSAEERAGSAVRLQRSTAVAGNVEETSVAGGPEQKGQAKRAKGRTSEGELINGRGTQVPASSEEVG